MKTFDFTDLGCNSPSRFSLICLYFGFNLFELTGHSYFV